MAAGCFGLAFGIGARGQAGYAFEQLTEFGFGTGVFEVSIAADRQERIAFRTTGSLDGPNHGGNYEIFLYDGGAGGSFTQVTDTPFGIGNFSPLLAPGGETIVFRSLFDFVGDGNGGQFELYEYDIASGVIDRVTTGTPLISDAALSTDASRRYVSVANDGTLAFRSEQPDLDPAASNGGGTNLGLFVARPAVPCPDADGDGVVGLGDLLAVLGGFGAAVGGGAADGDFDGDGLVGLEDLLAVLGAFGEPCV